MADQTKTGGRHVHKKTGPEEALGVTRILPDLRLKPMAEQAESD